MGAVPTGMTPQQSEAMRWVEQQRGELLRAEQVVKASAMESGLFLGTVARLSRATCTAVLDCLDFTQQHGGTAELSGRKMPADCEVGDTVVFRVVPQPGNRPQVTFAKRLLELTQQRQRIMEVEAPLPVPGAPSQSQEYLGFITSFQPDRGFGFIGCAQTRQVYGSDVYIHRDQYVELCVGDAVHFRVALSPKSLPVARGVRKAVGGPGGSSSAAPQGQRAARSSRSRSMSRSMSISGERPPGGKAGGPAPADEAAAQQSSRGGGDGGERSASRSRRRRRGRSGSKSRSKTRRKEKKHKGRRSSS